MNWTDQFSPDRIADVEQAIEDVREAHRWATRERDLAEPGSIREYCLSQERIRLAHIHAALKGARA